MPDLERPVPRPDALTASFWEACRQGVLQISACRDCGHLFLPPGPCCPNCWSERLAARPASGRGRVFTFAVYRRTYHPAIPAPYVVALIELEEGPRLISNVVGCLPEEVSAGMSVRLCFEAAGDFILPRFAPASDEGGGG